jgi:hypothetical protein
MLKSIFPLTLLLFVLYFPGSAAAANYEVVELSATHVMVVPKIWALEEEKGSKLIIVSYRETFKEALLTLGTRYNIKTIIPVEGYCKREDVLATGGSLSVGLILEVEKK